MLKQIKRDFADAGKLCKKHFQALIVVCVSTLALIVVVTPSLIHDFGAKHYNAFFYYGVLSLLSLIIITRQSPLKLGLGFGEIKQWLPASLLYLVIAIPLVLVGSQSAEMNNFYVSNNFDWPSYLFETTLYMLGWEYLFRGYMLVGLKKSLKEGAILVQMIPFTLMHLGKPNIETISCIFSGLAWGYICYRANSFWPAFFMHMVVNLTTQLYANGL